MRAPGAGVRGGQERVITPQDSQELDLAQYCNKGAVLQQGGKPPVSSWIEIRESSLQAGAGPGNRSLPVQR